MKYLILVAICFSASAQDTRYYFKGGGYLDGNKITETSEQIAVKTKFATVIVSKENIERTITLKQISSINTEVTVKIEGQAPPPKKEERTPFETKKEEPKKEEPKKEEPKKEEPKKEEPKKEDTQEETPKVETPKKDDTQQPVKTDDQEAYWSDAGRDFLEKYSGGAIPVEKAGEMLRKDVGLLSEMTGGIAKNSKYSGAIKTAIVSGKVYRAVDSLLEQMTYDHNMPGFSTAVDIFLELKSTTPLLLFKDMKGDTNLKDDVRAKMNQYYKTFPDFDRESADDWLYLVSPFGYGSTIVESNIRNLLYADATKTLKEIASALDSVYDAAKATGLQIISEGISNIPRESEDVRNALLAEVVKHLGEGPLPVRSWAVKAAGAFKDGSVVDQLLYQFDKDDEREVKIQVAYALGNIGRNAQIPVTNALLKLLQSKDFDVTVASSNSLKSMYNQNFGRDYEKWQAWWNANNPENKPTEEGRPEVPENK